MPMPPILTHRIITAPQAAERIAAEIANRAKAQQKVQEKAHPILERYFQAAENAVLDGLPVGERRTLRVFETPNREATALGRLIKLAVSKNETPNTEKSRQILQLLAMKNDLAKKYLPPAETRILDVLYGYHPITQMDGIIITKLNQKLAQNPQRINRNDVEVAEDVYYTTKDALERIMKDYTPERKAALQNRIKDIPEKDKTNQQRVAADILKEVEALKRREKAAKVTLEDIYKARSEQSFTDKFLNFFC